MARNIEIKLNISALRELRKSEEMCSILSAEAGKVASRAGDGYEVTAPYIGANRANVKVKPATAKAYYSNLKNNTLLKALG